MGYRSLQVELAFVSQQLTAALPRLCYIDEFIQLDAYSCLMLASTVRLIQQGCTANNEVTGRLLLYTVLFSNLLSCLVHQQRNNPQLNTKHYTCTQVHQKYPCSIGSRFTVNTYRLLSSGSPYKYICIQIGTV